MNIPSYPTKDRTPEAFELYNEHCPDDRPCPWCGMNWIVDVDRLGSPLTSATMKHTPSCPYWEWLA